MAFRTQAACVHRAYVLQTQITHTRLLPAASRHTFVYTVVSLILSLDALERHELDLLRGWLFGYGGIWGRVTGLRSTAYLHSSPQVRAQSIKQKLRDVLDDRGLPGSELHDAWLMTMPSFLGYEGINPLTLYFCYRCGETALWLVVLEVHNTFGERNVYVLKVGEREDVPRKPGFDHQWTFPRQFHVSPFNDRSGHYVCQLTAPSHPPFRSDDSETLPLLPPRPVVKITLLTAPPHSQRKIVAILRPTQSTILSSASLLHAVARAPFDLFLVFPRIVYQAFLLHYRKRLDVYRRPEPRAPDPGVEAHLPAVSNAVQPSDDPVGGGVGWQPTGIFEVWCKRRIYAFLSNHCAETGMSVTFIPSNPFEGPTTIAPVRNVKSGEKKDCELSIYYRSPRLFTILFMMPYPEHALLFGSQAEKIFSVSAEEVFITTFTPPSSAAPELTISSRLVRHIRRALVPAQFDLDLPSTHILDESTGFMDVIVLLTLWFFEALERRVFTIMGARFVPGDEPWGGWTRLHSIRQEIDGGLGSIRREYRQ